MVGVDVASCRKLQTHMEQYNYGPRFVLKASGGGGGPRFAWKVANPHGIVQLWTSFCTETAFQNTLRNKIIATIIYTKILPNFK